MPTKPTFAGHTDPRPKPHHRGSRWLAALRLTDGPTVKVYRGFGTTTQVTVQGHVLQLGPLPQPPDRPRSWTNFLDMLRLFLVRPMADAHVQVAGTAVLHQTDADGFFRFGWQPSSPLLPGWHPVQINLMSGPMGGAVLASGRGEVYVPYPTQYGFISDIDDTFLVSHSAKTLKRLWVLLAHTAQRRRPFEGVVAHYQALSLVGTTATRPNPFFYVSSSEWNLYEYLLAFLQKHALPNGVLLLSQLKQLRQLRQTGQGKHVTKLDRIARILATYPRHQFVLLGDDTQADPGLYATVVDHHPAQVRCVYLRQVGRRKKPAVSALVVAIETAGIPCCYFRHSNEAMRHSVSIGLL